VASPVGILVVSLYGPHREIDVRRDETLEWVRMRSNQAPGVVDLDIAPVEAPREAL
jgi:hypothetical protein